MRTVKKPDTRRQEILTGALNVFLRKGYEKTTIADIAQELGISQGLCYRYFPSKEMIYEEVIDTYAARIVQANLENRPENSSIRQWLEDIPKLLNWMEEAEKDSAQFYDLLHNPKNDRMHRELCWKVGEYLIPSVTKVLSESREKGEIQLEDCGKTAAFGVYGEIGLLILEGPDAVPAIQEQWRMLLGL